MAINQKTKEQAIALRKGGKSYGEIMKTLHLKSKGTLSAWFKNLKLTKLEKKRLKHNMDLAQKRGLHRFNIERSAKIKSENQKIHALSEAQIKSPSKYDLLLVGIALYWGEGSKANIEKYGYIDIANTDPKLIEVYMNFLRKILKVKDSRIRPVIHVHENIDPENAKRFWSRIARLPIERFGIYSAKSAASQNKRAKNRLLYGTLRVRVNSRHLVHTMKGYLEALAEKF